MKQQTINWNQIAELGLLERINREVMHPLGLAVCRDTESGVSPGALIADDGVWEFAPGMISKIIPDDEVRIKLEEIKKDSE